MKLYRPFITDIESNLFPDASGTLDMGSVSLAFNNGYIDKVYLEADPTTPLQAATKQYVDAAQQSPMPGGSDTQVQYNNGGVLGGASSITYDDGTGDVTLGASLLATASGTQDIGTVALSFDDAYIDKVYLEGDPITGFQATTKDYVDSLVQGLDWQPSVLGRRGAPVPGPSTGNRYIATATASGWTDNNIYEYNGTGWDETVANEGFSSWVEDEDVQYVFNGVDWVKFGSTATHNNLSGLQGGTASEYYHMTSTEYSGDWGSKDWTTNGNFTMGEYLYHDGDADTWIRFGDNAVYITAANVEMARFSGGSSITFNEAAQDVDFRVESDTITHALFIQGSDGFVGVGGVPTSTLHVQSASGGQAVLTVEQTTVNGAGYLNLKGDRSNADEDIGRILGYWSNTQICEMRFRTGADTINKDDGRIQFFTASGGVMGEWLEINEYGDINVGGGTVDNPVNIDQIVYIGGANHAGIVMEDETFGTSVTIFSRDGKIENAIDGTIVHAFNNDGSATWTQNSDTYTLAGDGTDWYQKWSDGNLYLMTDEGTNTNSNVYVAGKGTGQAALILKHGSGDLFYFKHDGTDAHGVWTDGDLRLKTDEGTNTDTRIHVEGKGTGSADILIKDGGDANTYMDLYCINTQFRFDSGSAITEVVFNETGNDTDFRVETFGTSEAFVVDGGLDEIQPGVDIVPNASGTLKIGTTAIAFGEGNFDNLQVNATPSGIFDVANKDYVDAQTSGAGQVTGFSYVVDGGGSAIGTGSKGFIEVPFACTINSWTMVCDVSATATMDVNRDTYADFDDASPSIVGGSSVPTISAALKGQDLDISDWTSVTIAAGDILGFDVDSNDNATQITLALKVTRT